MQQQESAEHGRDSTAQRMTAASLPMERMAEYLVQQMEAVGKQLHHTGMAQHAALHTLGSTVCVHSMQHHGVRGCVAMQLPDPTIAQGGDVETSQHPQHHVPTNLQHLANSTSGS